MSISSQIFATNMSSKKMKNAKTIEDVKNAMSPYSKSHEEAFWSYLCGRAVRAINKGASPSAVEQLALNKDSGVPCDAETSTIGYLGAIQKSLDVDPGDDYTDVIKVIKKLVPEQQQQDVFGWIENKAREHVANGTSPTGISDHISVYEFWRTLEKPIPEIETYPDVKEDIKLPPCVDDYEDEGTGVTTRTNRTFLVRELDDLLPFSDYITDITATKLPEKIAKDVPTRFHPVDGPTPYGLMFDYNVGGLFFEMMQYLRDDSIKPKYRDMLKPVLLNYMCRFLLLDENEKVVFWLRYNERGHVADIREMTLLNFKDTAWEHGELTGRRGENMFNLWKGMPMRTGVFKSVREPVTGPQKCIIPDKLRGKINKFLGLKVELEYDLDNWVLGTSVNEYNEPVNIQLVVDHIRNHFAQGDEYIFKWLLKWFYSVIIEKKKTEVAIILGGEQGSGKSMIVNKLIGQKIMGEGSIGAYKSISGLNLLVGRFNGSSGGKLLICGNEVDARTKHKSDTLKDIITEGTRNIERKGKEAEEVKDFSNIIITTNNSDCVKIEETDRRYFIQDIPRPKLGVEEYIEYFDNLADVCDCELSAPEFYMWLKTTVENDASIRNINLRKIPYTKAKQIRMQEDQHPMYRWLQEKYLNNKTWADGETVVQYDLLKLFQNEELYRNIKTTPQQFTKMFERLGFERGPERLGRCWKMMPLDDFVNKMKFNGKWNTEI